MALPTLDNVEADLYEPVTPPVEEAPAPETASMLSAEQCKAFSKSDEGRALAAWVDEQYKDARNKRRIYEKQWYLNLAFYSGRQYVEWNTNGAEQKLSEQRVKSVWTPRLVVNKIQPIVRTEQSKMTGQKPSASVMPSSNDDADIFAASAGEQVWESLYDRLNFQGKLSRATFWLSICGTSFMKAFWDANAWDAASEMDGDIQWLARSPFHILVPDLIEPDLEAQSWVMDVQERPVEWVKEAYGDYFPKGVTPTVSKTNEIMDAAGMGAAGDSKPDSAFIIEIWIKPGATKLLPKGGMVTQIDGVIVQAATDGIPYAHKEFPFAKMEHIPTGKFYCTSTIEALIPLQREYNRTQSQIVEAKNRMAKPQVFFREGSVDPAKITSEPGLYIPIKGTAEFPQPVSLTELPSYVVQFNERQEADFENISGQHAPTRGEAPAGMAATAIAYLQEQDDSYLATTSQSIEQAIQKIARHSLVLAATYWTVPRLVKATGDDGGYDAMMLKGSEIAGSTDIRVDHGSALPTSKAAKQAQVSEWMKMGWIDPNEGFELLEMPMLQQWVNRRKVDKKAAQIENIDFRSLAPEDALEFQQEEVFRRKEELQQWFTQQSEQIAATAAMPPAPVDPTGAAPVDPAEQAPLPEEQGGPAALGTPPAPPAPAPNQLGALTPPDALQLPSIIPVNDWDDHAIHIEIHNLWRKSPSYRFIPDPIKAEVEKHVQMHKAALAEQQYSEAMMGAGAPAGGGAMPPMPQGMRDALDSPVTGTTEEQLNAPQ